MKGKNIIITGANRGIGKVLVEMFAKAGTNVWAPHFGIILIKYVFCQFINFGLP